MLFYVDTSVIAHAVLPGGSPLVRPWMDTTIADGHDMVSSRLVHLELTRLVRRENLPLAIIEPAVDRIGLIKLDDDILEAAEAIEPHVKSLDAIHLATLLRTDPTMTLATHDVGMRRAAKELGLTTFDPLDPATPT